MITDRRTRRLINGCSVGHTKEPVEIFGASNEQSIWRCPFCELDSPYYLSVPSTTKPKQLSKIKILIKEHIELHQQNVVEELIQLNAFTDYKKHKENDSNRTRKWIAATIDDLELYRHPFEENK